MSLEKIDKVWLVLYTKKSIEIVGVFSDIQKAVAICDDQFYVVGPFEVDKDYTHIMEWEGAFRPSGDPLYPETNYCECTLESGCDCGVDK